MNALPISQANDQLEDPDTEATTAMLQDWQAQDRRRIELLQQHLLAVLEVARTWQPDYATLMDRNTLDLAAAEVGHVAHQPAPEPMDAQATPIPCALNVAGVTHPAGTPFCDVIDKVMSELESARRKLDSLPAGGVAEPIAWEAITLGYTRFITQARWEKLRPKARRWYVPYRCPACAAINLSSLPDRDPRFGDKAHGVYRKFEVRRTDGKDRPGDKHHDCEYFVLDVTHDPHAKAALQAYANACDSTHQVLAADMRDRYGLATSQPSETPVPIPMVLHCPKCGMQHIDGPEAELGPNADGSGDMPLWSNPDHRSHLCHGCGTIWRPADVPTTGVKATATKGKADNWAPSETQGRRQMTDAEERQLAIGKAIERAASELPEFYDLEVCVERGSAWVTLTCPEAENIAPTFDGDHTLAEQVDGCIEAAIRHAIPASPQDDRGVKA